MENEIEFLERLEKRIKKDYENDLIHYKSYIGFTIIGKRIEELKDE